MKQEGKPEQRQGDVKQWRVEGTRNNSTYGGHAGQAVGVVRAEAEGTMCRTKEFEL